MISTQESAKFKDSPLKVAFRADLIADSMPPMAPVEPDGGGLRLMKAG